MQLEQSRMIGGGGPTGAYQQTMGAGIQQSPMGMNFMTPGPNMDLSLTLDTQGDSEQMGTQMVNGYQSEIQRLRFQNNQLMYQREVREKDFENVMFENQTLFNKLENLENVFIGQPSRRPNPLSMSQAASDNLTQEYAESTIQVENNELRRKVAQLEQEKMEMKAMLQQNGLMQ